MPTSPVVWKPLLFAILTMNMVATKFDGGRFIDGKRFELCDSQAWHVKVLNYTSSFNLSFLFFSISFLLIHQFSQTMFLSVLFASINAKLLYLLFYDLFRYFWQSNIMFKLFMVQLLFIQYWFIKTPKVISTAFR